MIQAIFSAGCKVKSFFSGVSFMVKPLMLVSRCDLVNTQMTHLRIKISMIHQEFRFQEVN